MGFGIYCQWLMVSNLRPAHIVLRIKNVAQASWFTVSVSGFRVLRPAEITLGLDPEL